MTLTEIFKSHEGELKDKLNGMSLPQDAKKVHQTVADFINYLFENDGRYRQSLTQSEDYILQAAIQLMQTQQNIALEMVKNAASYKMHHPSENKKSEKNPYTPLGGTALGAAAGALFGPVGIVGGAIAGTAIAVYLTTKSKKNFVSNDPTVAPKINVNAFTDIVVKVCESIDNLMETYRIQVKRIENALSQKEEVTLQNTYSSLLDQIQNVLKVSEQTEDMPDKLKKAISYLEESLHNYELEYKDGKIVSEQN